MRQIFVGVDVRQPVAFTVLQHSIIARSSVPVAVTPLLIDQLPIKRRGLTDFTFTRYLVPYLMGYKGTALFLDADMLVLSDIEELFQLADGSAVQVVKHGPERRFEWPSLMLFNCEKCQALTPEYIEQNMPQTFKWGEVGALPREWNFLVGYDEANELPKILHYTMGIPAFKEVQKLGFVDEWHQELRASCSTVTWEELMGSSVHAKVLSGT